MIKQYYKFHGYDSWSSWNVAHISFYSSIGDDLESEYFYIALDQYIEEKNNLIFGLEADRYLSYVIETGIP